MRDSAAIEFELLRAMRMLDQPQRIKCDRVLRAALQSMNRYDKDASEFALCNDGNEDPEVRQLYNVLREMIRCGLAEGAGDLQLPAGPRYTECRITLAGRRRLDDLLCSSPIPNDRT